MLTNIYPILKIANLFYINFDIGIREVPVIFRGLFVVLFLFVIFFTGEEGKKRVETITGSEK